MLAFGSNEIQQCVNVSIIDDLMYEPCETFRLTLSSSSTTPSFVSLDVTAGAVVILDNDEDNIGMSRFKVLSAEELGNISLRQNPELLKYAACTGETVRIEVTAEEQGGIVQEGVTTIIDCDPWLRRFPNGTVRWYKYLYEDLDHSNLYFRGEQRPEVLNSVTFPRAVITGDYNEIYTIIISIILLDAEDPTRGIYECQVCVVEGLSETELCHSANTTIANVGRPTILDVGVGRGEFDARIMPIGERMQHVFGECLRESQERTRLYYRVT